MIAFDGGMGYLPVSGSMNEYAREERHEKTEKDPDPGFHAG